MSHADTHTRPLFGEDREPASNSPADVGWSEADRGRAPLTFLIPKGTPAKSCRSCQATIYWITTGNGRAMPVDADGKSHFATCPNAKQHRRPR